MTALPPTQYISERELREMFNAERYEEHVQAGLLTVAILKSKPVLRSLPGIQAGSESQIIAYLDLNGDEVAMAHRYYQPDGTLGASGRPDPKRILKDGILYLPWWGSPINERSHVFAHGST